MRTCVVLLVAGCASSHPSDPIASPSPPERHVTITVSEITLVPEPPPLPRVRFLANTLLRKQPGDGKVGIVRKGTVSAVLGEAPASDGCNGTWLHIAPRGWACETQVASTTDAATTAPPAALDDNDDGEPLVTGVYGIVRGEHVQAFGSKDDAASGTGRELTGATSVRAAGLVKVGDQRFWRTSSGDLIDESAIIQISPSRFHGIVLDGEMPAWRRKDRTIVTVEELSEDGKLARIGEDTWMPRKDLRIATLAEPPPGTGKDERWFDIDLDEQVLVAYEGERPVYATLVSTGKWQHETPASIARISEKLERAPMNSEKPGELYSVADVPWTMYYDHNFALHTSYWHDGFGSPRSHGCVNLAPRDAKLLYRWSSPDVPPGWTVVYADEDTPGSLVRVRSRKVPEPAFRGYAKGLHEKQLLVTMEP